MDRIKVETTHGRVSVIDGGGSGPSVLMVHGNSLNAALFGPLMSSRLSTNYRLVAFDLPDDYYSTYARVIQATTADDVRRVATQYLQPEHLVIAIVGDRKTIEPRLRALGIGSLTTVAIDELFATPR